MKCQNGLYYLLRKVITKKILKQISYDTCRASLTQHTSSIADA